jgi:CRP-like cAMP-binding protein
MDTTRLKHLKLFAGLSDADLAHVGAWATELSVPTGTTLMREGDYSCDLFGILEGTAEVRRHGRVVAQLEPGDTVGEIGMLSGDRRCATVVATSPMYLVRLTHWDTRRLDAGAPQAATALRQLAKERLALAA